MRIFNRRAQNLMEYTLLMAGAVAIAIVALRQGGLVDKTVNKSLDISVSGVECMALNTCYDPDGCPFVCGNGCCEAHAETAGSCWADCECSNPLECDDGIYCNGVEECGGNQHCRHGASLGAGKDAGLCVECDGGGGELAVLDDPECGNIDCSGYNYFHHAATTADAMDVETCYLREFAAITSGRCDGIRKCKEPDIVNCAASTDNPKYLCGTCKYIADIDCDGTVKGDCSPSPALTECGIENCDLHDLPPCRDYHEVTRYCDGGGNCATPECNVYTNAVDGTHVELCTVCDGSGGQRMAVDDVDCAPIICAGYNYYFQTGDESPMATETCTYRSYLDVTTERCAAMGVCKTADAGICLGYDDSYPYSCGTCQYIAAGDCTGNNPGSCSNYADGTDAGLCIECNGVGGERAGMDDSGCGVIDCDGRNFYSQSGEESPTGIEVCTYRDYTDIESDRCEGMNDCKDENSEDCKSYGETEPYQCGICQYIKTGDCQDKNKGHCTNYEVGTLAHVCGACDGNGYQVPIVDDERCGTIDCTGLDYYYSEVSPTNPDVQTCYHKVHADLTTDRCVGINECKTGIEAHCTESTPVFQYDCGECKEIGVGECDGATTKGECSNSNTLTTCGTKDCDTLDNPCRDYHDVPKYCDGAGGCTDPVCNSYTDLDTSTACGTKDCDPLDVTCRNYHDVTNYCDGAGSCGESACEAFTNVVAGTDAGLCTECNGSGGVMAAVDDATCGTIMCEELNHYVKTLAGNPDLGDDVCYHREYANLGADRCEAMNDCKDVEIADCVNLTDVHWYTCGVCKYIAAGDCEDAKEGPVTCTPSLEKTDTGTCAECDGNGGERAPLDDIDCGIIDCDGLDGYIKDGIKSPVATQTCTLQNYEDITTGRCKDLKKCKDPNSADCAAPVNEFQYECGTCQYIADTDCMGTSKGGCTNYDTSAVCGTKDCDTLDTNCRNYHDVAMHCDGAGGCTDPVCNSYTDLDTSTACGTKDCDPLDITCRNYDDVTNYCDGAGSCGESACNAFTDEPDGTHVGMCELCNGSGGTKAAADDQTCGLIACEGLNHYEKVVTVSPPSETCYHREYITMSQNRCEGINDCKDVGVVGLTDCTDIVSVPFTCPSCQNLTGCSGTTPGSCIDKTCASEIFSDPNGKVSCTFSASPQSTTPVTLDCSTCTPGGNANYTGNFSRTCDCGNWVTPTGGCVAQGCGKSGSYNIGEGLTGSFDPIGHGQTQHIICNDINNTYTGDAYLDCSFGTWVDSSLDAGCRAFACQDPYAGFVKPTYSTLCLDSGSVADNVQLIADDTWSIVNNTYTDNTAGCTDNRKCEYRCAYGYIKEGFDCVEAVCQGNNPDPDGHAVPCNPMRPPSSTSRTLDQYCGASANMCDYACPWPYRYYTPASGDPYCCYETCPPGVCSGNRILCGVSTFCSTCLSCTGPDGSYIGNGQSVWYYKPNKCGNSCNNSSNYQLRKCTNGVLSGSNTYSSRGCGSCGASCTDLDGTIVSSGGASKKRYKSALAPCGSFCEYETLYCENGTWTKWLSTVNGWTEPSCAVDTNCCGNLACDNGETCSTCPGDCGSGTFLVNGAHTKCGCELSGGSVVTVSGNTFCGFTGTSCPAGWTPYGNWSITQSQFCEDCDNAYAYCDGASYVASLYACGLGFSCNSSYCCAVTSGHATWQDQIESCPYDGATTNLWGCHDQNHTCTAKVTSRGCY